MKRFYVVDLVKIDSKEVEESESLNLSKLG
jgi:hypothetical protein